MIPLIDVATLEFQKLRYVSLAPLSYNFFVPQTSMMDNYLNTVPRIVSWPPGIFETPYYLLIHFFLKIFIECILRKRKREENRFCNVPASAKTRLFA